MNLYFIRSRRTRALGAAGPASARGDEGVAQVCDWPALLMLATRIGRCRQSLDLAKNFIHYKSPAYSAAVYCVRHD
jgi:hypothetical protein